MYRIDINCLRGFSLVFIILYHYIPKTFSGGFIGVDILFSISGYLIFYSLSSRKEYTLHSFYANRIKRLSSSKIVVLFGIVIAYWNIDLINFIELLNQCKSSLMFYLNYYYQLKNVDYLSVSQEKFNSPVLHFWSLSIEFQFYIIAPLLISLHKYNTILHIFLIPLLIYYSYSYTNSNYANSYFSFLIRLLDFCIGIISANISVEINTLTKLIGFVFILMFSIVKCLDTYYPGFIIILPMIFSFCFLSSSDNNSFLKLSLFNYIGTISYSLYLVHYPFVFIDNVMLKLLLPIILANILFTFIEKSTRSINFDSKIVILLYISFVYLFIILSDVIIKERYQKLKMHIYNSVWNYNNRFIKKCIVYYYFNNKKLLKSYILLLGDSHMQHFFPAINSFLLKNNFTAIGVYFWVNRIINNDYLILKYAFYIIKNPILVLMSFRLSKFSYIPNITLFNEKIPHFIKFIKIYCNNIILFDESPTHNYNPYKLFYSSKHSNSYCLVGVNCTISEYIISKDINITYLSIRKILCNNNICPDTINNTLVYADFDHFTLEFSLSLKFFFNNILEIYTKSYKSSYLYSECVISREGWFNIFKTKILKNNFTSS